MSLKRHIGKIANTGTRVYVVFRELPDDPTHCLVVEIDRLPDMYQDNLKTIVESREGQNSVDLYTVLNNKLLGDGLPALRTMHDRSFLRKVEVRQVFMQPYPGTNVALELINSQIREAALAGADPVHTETASVPVVEESITDKQRAEGLIVQARLLKEEADAKLELAYSLCPELKPAPGRQRELTEEELEERYKERLEKRKEKRREARQKREEEKARALLEESKAKAVEELELKVSQKLERDSTRAE
ncbi:hypothetical protein RVBP17_2540 [Pseudomonas phage sp. 30-3]|uniref:Uncharacterized protein n=1 Tax=Pseudomonas phage vB_PaeM_PA5oct TaxID=2163605 RepID=A0A4Y1LVB6_9CAUD|nr:hypothetical protein PQE65_gp140 [Pseudomonas phage vB_PaeM_PA5oct]WMI31888.1 hypothetical protein GBBBJNDB_00185 [Pseudomonas phage Callisto]WPK38821.1 hypothetical protein Cassandra_0145 [Pseudomonas phage Cassandra]WPK39342.1 hypothetical protein Deiofobo_0145 [Pseudomonas phage Deifobo]WPK39854.1 hypothetical protein ETTORE_0145 [Pseudomonas phage Ettore]VOH54717.1 hypothetical protein MIJ3_00185 [Pseudomonas phage vB_PaeM_MIJ3]BDR25703.1 hypothetical protein RVBP16_1430 [Pseudomonas p